jgi:hypothetical protein
LEHRHVNSSDTLAAACPAKILLVKSEQQESHGWAFVLTGQGVYTRSLGSCGEIDAVMDDETFHLVVNDARGHAENPFLFVERFRRHQPTSPLLLLCPRQEFDGVVKAIRCGVSDILSPPFDFQALHERALELIRGGLHGSATNVSAGRWFEIARFLNEPAAVAAEAPVTTSRWRKRPPTVDAALATLRADHHRIVAELQVERQARAAAERACERALADLERVRTEGPALRGGSDSAAPGDEARRAEFDAALAGMARREQALAAGAKAQQIAARQLSDERAHFEAERAAESAKLADAREQRVREQEAFELMIIEKETSLERREEDLARRKAAFDAGRMRVEGGGHPPAADGAGSAAGVAGGRPASEMTFSLSGLAARAAEFAAMTKAVAELQVQLEAERASHAAAVETATNALRNREAAVTELETTAADRITAAEAYLEANRLTLQEEQRALAAARVELDSALRDLARRETKLTEREDAHATNAARLAEAEARLEEMRAAGAKAGAARKQQEEDLSRRAAQIEQRSAELQQKQAEVDATAAETLAARKEAAALQESLARGQAELDAGFARLSTEAGALVRARRDQKLASAGFEQRSAELAEQARVLENERAAAAKEAQAMQEAAAAVMADRATLEGERAALEALTTALAERERAFEVRRRQLRENVSSLFAD